MGVRKKWDLPSEHRAALLVLSAVFLLGGGLGCLFAALANEAGAQELADYLADYLSLALDGRLPRGLWVVLWRQLKYLLAALVLGLTALGVVGLPLLFGAQGFAFTFSVACFCRVFGVRGLFPAFAIFGVPALLWVPALFFVGPPGFLSAQRRLRLSLGEGGGSPLNGGFWPRAGLCTALGLAAGLLEYWAVPVLLRTAARLVL